jgi:hypothetical protein
LGIASLSESAVGKIQVYTCETLPSIRDGQVVRIRFSRPTISLVETDPHNYQANLDDREHGGVSVLIPKAAARKLGLPYTNIQPGLSFYIALEPAGLRAVGTTWRPDTRTYTW